MSRKDEPDPTRESSLSRFSVNDTPLAPQNRPTSSQLMPRPPKTRGTQEKTTSRNTFSPVMLHNLLARATTTLDVQIMVLLSQTSDERSLAEFIFPIRLLVVRRDALIRCFADAPNDSVLREVFVSTAQTATELAADMAAGGARQANQLYTFARELLSELTLRGDASAPSFKGLLTAQRQALEQAIEARPAPFHPALVRQLCQLGLDLTMKLGTSVKKTKSSWLDLCLAGLTARD